MTNDTLKAELLFDPSVPDEETELGALAASLRLANGFSLLFARCNQPDQRRRLINSLREQHPQLKLQEIEFREPILYLLDELRDRIEEPAPDAIFVSGLEYSFPVAAQAANAPLTATLNISRDSFGRYLPCPLVLWVPEYVLTAIMHGAPDFFSVRSGVYFFASSLAETFDTRQNALSGEEWAIANLSIVDKEERLTTVTNLLADYQSLPSERRDFTTEAALLSRLANLYKTLGRWNEAEVTLRRCIQITNQIGIPINQAIALNNLGTIYQLQNRSEEALDVYNQSLLLAANAQDTVGSGQALLNLGTVLVSLERLEEAERAYEESINLLAAAGEHYAVNAAMNNLADVYLRQGNHNKALSQAEENLKVARRKRDRVGEADALYKLGEIYTKLEDFSGAETYYQQSLKIRHSTGDYNGEQASSYLLGLIYVRQNRWAEAEEKFQKSLQIQRAIGDQFGQAKSLESLAVMRLVQGDAIAAMRLAQEAMGLLQPFKSTSEYERVSAMIENLQHHLEVESEEVS